MSLDALRVNPSALDQYPRAITNYLRPSQSRINFLIKFLNDDTKKIRFFYESVDLRALEVKATPAWVCGSMVYTKK